MVVCPKCGEEFDVLEYRGICPYCEAYYYSKMPWPKPSTGIEGLKSFISKIPILGRALRHEPLLKEKEAEPPFLGEKVSRGAIWAGRKAAAEVGWAKKKVVKYMPKEFEWKPPEERFLRRHPPGEATAAGVRWAKEKVVEYMPKKFEWKSPEELFHKRHPPVEAIKGGALYAGKKVVGGAKITFKVAKEPEWAARRFAEKAGIKEEFKGEEYQKKLAEMEKWGREGTKVPGAGVIRKLGKIGAGMEVIGGKLPFKAKQNLILSSLFAIGVFASFAFGLLWLGITFALLIFYIWLPSEADVRYGIEKRKYKMEAEAREEAEEEVKGKGAPTPEEVPAELAEEAAKKAEKAREEMKEYEEMTREEPKGVKGKISSFFKKKKK